MRARLAGAHKPHSLKQVNRPAKPNHLQAQRSLELPCFVLQFVKEKCSQPDAAVRRHNGEVDTANFVFTPFNNQPAGRLACYYHDLVDGILIIGLMELLLGLILKA